MSARWWSPGLHGRRFPHGRITLLAALIAVPLAPVGTSQAVGTPDLTSGTDVRVNTPGEGEALTCDIQSEVTLARHGNNLVAGWNDSGACDEYIEAYLRARLGEPRDRSSPGFSISGRGWWDDAAGRWRDAGTLTPAPGWDLTGDPVLAAGLDGTFFYATMATDGTGAPERSTIAVARSTDGGRTFSVPVDAALGGVERAFRDKPWIAVDTTDSAFRGTVYVVFSEFLPRPSLLAAPPAPCIWVSRSVDDGLTFEPPTKVVCGPFFWAPQVAVGAESQVYLAWTDNNLLYFAKSVDGGRTFNTSTETRLDSRVAQWRQPLGHQQTVCLSWDTVTRLIFRQEQPPVGGGLIPLPFFSDIPRVLDGDIRVDNIPSMAVDTFGSSDPEDPDFNPYRGRIYIAVAVNMENVLLSDEADIAVVRSDDGGESWSPVTPPYPYFGRTFRDTFDGEDTQTDQFHPQVAVNPDSTVAVSWYDRRRSRDALGGDRNWEIDVYAAISTDGGESFNDASPLQVTDRFFPPAQTNPNTGMFSGCYMGEYNGMVAGEPGEFLLAWGDNRDTSPTAGLPDPNVYFDRIRY